MALLARYIARLHLAALALRAFLLPLGMGAETSMAGRVVLVFYQEIGGESARA
jgi:hypothetical protein